MTSVPLRQARGDSKLDELMRRYPRWRIWRGHATGDIWALPPRGHPQPGLVSAADADELEAKVAASDENADDNWLS